MRPVQHTDNCPGADVKVKMGAKGGALLRCRGCGRFVPLDPEVDKAAWREPEPPAQPRLASLVCRPHHAPVKPNGKGCAECDAELALTRVQRRARRRQEQRDAAATDPVGW